MASRPAHIVLHHGSPTHGPCRPTPDFYPVSQTETLGRSLGRERSKSLCAVSSRCYAYFGSWGGEYHAFEDALRDIDVRLGADRGTG